MTVLFTLLFLLLMFAGCAAVITFLFSIIAFIYDKITNEPEETEENLTHNDYD